MCTESLAINKPGTVGSYPLQDERPANIRPTLLKSKLSTLEIVTIQGAKTGSTSSPTILFKATTAKFRMLEFIESTRSHNAHHIHGDNLYVD